MKKPTIEVKCGMTSADTLVIQHDPYDTDSDFVWIKMTEEGKPSYIRMSCERALALGKAMKKTYKRISRRQKKILKARTLTRNWGPIWYSKEEWLEYWRDQFATDWGKYSLTIVLEKF